MGGCIRPIGFQAAEDSKIWNVLNGMGYIPGIALIPGIYRIYYGVVVVQEALKPEVPPDKRALGLKWGFGHIARGVIECIGCGILLLIPDLLSKKQGNPTR